MKRRTINGYPIAFHLDNRLEKLKANFDRLQTLQDELLEKFNSEHLPNWRTNLE